MRLFSEVAERLRCLFLRNRQESELNEELEFHREAAIEENLRRGMSPAEARRQAAIRLGGIEFIKEEVRDERGTRILEDILRDLRIACRRLLRDPGYSLPVIASLAVGIGVSVALFCLVNAVLLRPLPYPDSDRLVKLEHRARTELGLSGLSPGIFLHYRAGNRSLQELAVYLDDARVLTDVEQPEQVRVALISSGFFNVFQNPPALGSLPAGDDSVLLGYDLWVRRYGADPEIIGKSIEIDRERHRVAGVAALGFHYPHPGTELWIISQMEALLTRFGGRAQIGGLYLQGIARLRPGQTAESAEQDLNRLVETLPDVFPDVTQQALQQVGLQAAVLPLKERIVGQVRVGVLLLAAVAGFLLLITWANSTNLSLLRSEKQRETVAIERALGATTGRLVQRFLGETAVLSALGGLGGFVLAELAVGAQLGFQSTQIPRLEEMVTDSQSAAFTVALSIVTALLLAASVSLSLKQSHHLGSLAERLRSFAAGRRRERMRQILAGTQVALATTLLIGAMLLLASYRQLARIDLGFQPAGAITFSLPLPSEPYRDRRASMELHREVLQQLRRLPGVAAAESATVAAFPLTPVPDYFHDQVSSSDAEFGNGTPFRGLFSFATPGYFAAMGIPILQGRTFGREVITRSPEAILSSRLAQQLFPGQVPVGRQVGSQNTGLAEYTVVGVVGDVPSRSLQEGAAGILYLPNLAAEGEKAPAPPIVLRDEQYVLRASLPPSVILPAVRAAIDGVDAKLAMTGVGSLEDLVSESLAAARLTMLFLLAGSATALFLGLVGIYSVLSYAMRRRTRELGVRMALGASPLGIAAMVTRRGASLALAGILVGLAAASGLTDFLDGLLYQVNPHDPAAFVVPAFALFASALIASYIPARRAARIDPGRSLKDG